MKVMLGCEKENYVENMQISDPSVPFSHWQRAGQVSLYLRDKNGIISEKSSADRRPEGISVGGDGEYPFPSSLLCATLSIYLLPLPPSQSALPVLSVILI